MADGKASKVFLIAAVILGVLATVMAFAYIDNSATESGGGAKTKILIAARDLRANTPLDPSKDFEVVEVPQLFKGFATQVLTPAVRDTYKGQRLNRRVLAGQPVMLADLSSSAEMTVAPGMFAISIPAKGPMGLSGLLVPGDRVKLLVTQTTSTGTGVLTDTIIAGKTAADPNPTFRVLAVGNQLTRSRSRITAVEQYELANESEGQQTVTLEVTEEQARLIVASSNGYRAPMTLILASNSTQPAARGN